MSPGHEKEGKLNSLIDCTREIKNNQKHQKWTHFQKKVLYSVWIEYIIE